MLFSVDRRRYADRFLEWKIWTFSIASGVMLVGMYFEVRWMTGVALALLLGAAVLRLLPGGAATGQADEDDGDGVLEGRDSDEDGTLDP